MSVRFCSGCEKTPLRRDNVTGLCARCIKATAKGRQAKQRPDDTLEVQGDKATLTKRTTETVRTLADLIRVCQIDTTEWVVKRWVANKWEMGSADNDPQQLYQIKAFLERNAPIQAVKAEIASLLEDARAALLPLRSERMGEGTPGMGDQGVLLEIAIPDLHLGKLAWAPETRYSDYDLKIAEKLFDEALETLLERTQHFAVNQIVFPVGNDLLHSDTKQGTTTKGTQLDTDSRYYKAFSVGRRMISRAIDRLRQIAPVTVVCVAGNHDQLSTYHLSDSLSCLYQGESDVTILGDPTLRKYFAWGKVAILYTHGDKGKATDWPLLFATEQPKMFGESLFREVHVGHFHQTRVQEFHGVRVRISPALCPPDAWHSDNQFVGNRRGAEAYVYDAEEGLISIAHFNVMC